MKLLKIYLFVIPLILIVNYSCSDLKEDISAPVSSSGIHGEGVLNKNSPNFHGGYLVNKEFIFCQKCHAGDFSGGITGVSCNSSLCHPAISVHSFRPTGSDSVYPNVHGAFIRKNGWNMDGCKTCHGTNYSGGISSPTCQTCHKSSNGPEACNTCHGNFNDGILTDSTRLAPPRTVLSEDNSAAGAHVSHLYENDLTANVDCEQCHVVPNKVNDPGHIIPGATHATLTFGDLAKNLGADPSYNYDNKKCSNVYCHGNFTFFKDSTSFAFIYTDSLIIGNNFQPQWNKLDDSQAECGTCHSLPPIGHQNAGNDPEATTCSVCHLGVGADGTIIDSTKHINGKINVFGN